MIDDERARRGTTGVAHVTQPNSAGSELPPHTATEPIRDDLRVEARSGRDEAEATGAEPAQPDAAQFRTQISGSSFYTAMRVMPKLVPERMPASNALLFPVPCDASFGPGPFLDQCDQRMHIGRGRDVPQFVERTTPVYGGRQIDEQSHANS